MTIPDYNLQIDVHYQKNPIAQGIYFPSTPRIVLLDNGRKAQIIIALIHELKHHRDKIRGILPFLPNMRSEYRAMKAALQYARHSGKQEYIKAAKAVIECNAADDVVHDVHYDAAKLLMKEECYDKLSKL